MRLTLRTLAPLAVLTLGLTAAALGGGLPNLPKDRPLPQGPDSPGVVTFRHANNVDSTRPDCTTCHPALFPILKGSAAARPASSIRHAEMEKGRLCGSCHDGKGAHGLDDCATCHEPQKER